jgi:hypothetical protein
MNTRNKNILLFFLFVSATLKLNAQVNFPTWTSNDSMKCYTFGKDSLNFEFIKEKELWKGKDYSFLSSPSKLLKFVKSCGSIDDYITQNLTYPYSSQKITLPIRIGFIIDSKGNLLNIGIIKNSIPSSVNEVYLENALKLVEKMNQDLCWKNKSGKNVYIEISIRFKGGELRK